MTTSEIIELVWYSIGFFVLVAMFIFSGKDLGWFQKSKKMHPYMIVYHKREAKTDEREFTPVEFAKTEQKAKAATMGELAGNLEYNSASIYFLNSDCGFMVKIAEFNQNENGKRNDEIRLPIDNTDDENTRR